MNAPSGAEHSVLADVVAQADKPIRWHLSTVLNILNWTSSVRSIRITRPEGFRFVAGHFVRLGLDDGTGSIVWRPFSMVSGEDDRYLEFVIVSIPGGAFSECMGRVLFEGAEIYVEKLSLGFLTLDQLSPGRDLWLIASGTGIGPFISILRTPWLYAGFERIVLAHSVRYSPELTYREEIKKIAGSLLLDGRLSYIPVVTRESVAGMFQERLTVLLTQSTLQGYVGINLDVAHSRVMVCGNPELTRDMRSILTARGFKTGRRGVRGQMVFEKYW